MALIFLVFFVQGACRAPDVNEPYYLSKAKHYWDAQWCANDFFCGTGDAHQVFYWTFGWLSRCLSLPALAWCGRLLTWGLLAWSWRRLSAALVPAPLYAVLSAALLVMLNERFQMAGEWVVGGFEAKGFAYVLIFLGLEALVRGRWARSCLLFGASSSFHVILGGWALVAWTIAWFASADRPPLLKIALPVAGAALLALPGLLPALALTWHADPQIVDQANRIYVYERLSHHLAPQSFPSTFVVRHLLLVGLLVALVVKAPRDARFGRLRAFLAAAVGLAAIGMALGTVVPLDAGLAARWLRYYWFRMSDVMVPLGVALLVADQLLRMSSTRPAWRTAALVAVLLAVSGHLGERVWWRYENRRPPADAAIANLEAWQDACAWAATETAPDAVFLTPRLAQTFRWYANRAEVVSRKDIPQDAAGIVEWWRRMNLIHRPPSGSANEWRESLTELGAAQLKRLGAEFGAEYVITSADPPLNLPRVGPINPSIAIYRLASPAAPLHPAPRAK